MFDNILGNEENKKVLENMVKKGNILHSYIFSGESGIGKFLLAKEFAKAVLCKETEKPCKKCESCISFDSGNNPDITIIEVEEKSIKTETIKNLVKDVYEKPIRSDKKVYIINDSEKMTKEAQNSLLKTLEEPPEYVVIVLITDNENLLLNTIKSRCMKIAFRGLKTNEVESILREKYSINKVSKNVLEIANGSIEKALQIHGKEDALDDIKQTFTNIEKTNIIDLLNKKDALFKDKDLANETLDFINIVLFDNIKTNYKYAECVKIVEETKDRLRKNSNFDMSIDNMLLKIWEEING